MDKRFKTRIVIDIYDRNFSQEVDAVRKEMAKAAIRLFDLGIAPEEFVLKIY